MTTSLITILKKIFEIRKEKKRKPWRVSFTFVSDNVTESVSGREKHKGDITTRPTTSSEEEALAAVEKNKKVSGHGRGRERPRGRGSK